MLPSLQDCLADHNSPLRVQVELLQFPPSHAALNRADRVVVLGTSTGDSVLSWYSTALDQSCHIWCCVGPEVDWRSFTTNEGKFG